MLGKFELFRLDHVKNSYVCLLDGNVNPGLINHGL